MPASSPNLDALFDGLAQIAAAQVLQIIAEHAGQDGLLPVLDGLLHLAEQCRAARQCLPATLVAAGAFGAVDFQDHVADFARRAVEAGE